MTRLKRIGLYNAEDVPDHIIQEVEELNIKLAKAITDACYGHSQNILIAALNRTHAAIICTLVTKEGLREAARSEAIAIMQNIEHMSGVKIMERG